MRKIDLDTVELIIFGDFGVLTSTPFRDHQPLHMLPGRAEYLAYLREDRTQRGGPDLKFAVAANKGGVAFGIQSEEEAFEEVRWTAEQIAAQGFAVCFAHPDAKAGYETYKTPEALANRKPAPGMIEQIVRDLGVPKEKVLVVGNYSDDCRAAKSAGVAWEVSSSFFREAERSASAAGGEESPADTSGDLGPLDGFDPFKLQRGIL